MRLPSFVIIGAAKAATSSLRALIAAHPQVFLARGGVETRFFARDDLFSRGVEWYASLFADAPDASVLGECSNVYSERDRFPLTAERLARHLSEAKLIYMVRDPLPRIASLWTQFRSHGGEQVHYDFGTALQKDRIMLVESTDYWRQLEPYRALLPDSKILILFFEEFAADPGAVMVDVCRFIGIDPEVELNASTHQNRSSGKLGPPPWLSRLRGSPAFGLLRRTIPDGIRIQMRNKLLFRPISPPMWTPELRREVLDRLRGNSMKLLDHCNRPRSLWTLE